MVKQMIILICPKCDEGEGNIDHNDSEDTDAKTFKCCNCGCEFNLEESEWRSE